MEKALLIDCPQSVFMLPLAAGLIDGAFAQNIH